MLNYIGRVGIAISVLLNVLILGQSNQTLSARNYELKRQDKFNFVWIIDRIFYLDKNHCLTCWAYWVTRKDIMYLIENGELLIWPKVKVPQERRKLLAVFTRMLKRVH